MPDFKCSAHLGKPLPPSPPTDWLCDRPAEYQINGTIMCRSHALSVQTEPAWRSWLDGLQSPGPDGGKQREVITNGQN